jgi:hypothetical protein
MQSKKRKERKIKELRTNGEKKGKELGTNKDKRKKKKRVRNKRR